MKLDHCYLGDCRAIMRDLLAGGSVGKVQTIVTSPPYFGLRDYGVAGQIGLEPLHDCQGWATGARCGACYVCVMVEVFREVRRVLRHDGTVWLNLGDSYASSGGGGHQGKHGERYNRRHTQRNILGNTTNHGLKPKDLIGQPWRIAFALQADGWYLRQDIIWHKPNPMPESVRDRCTKAHEYLFLLSKSERYYFDQEAIKEPVNGGAHARAPGNHNHKGTQAYLNGDELHRTKAGLVEYAERQRAKHYKTPDGWDTSKGDGGHGNFHREGREAGYVGYEHRPRHDSVEARKMRAHEDTKQMPTDERNGMRPVGVGPKARPSKGVPNEPRVKHNESFSASITDLVETRNRRSVWTIPTEAFSEAHFATFPQALVEPCILAGSRPGDIVFDPFMGTGTVAQVAQRLGRKWVGVELNPDYLKMQRWRIAQLGMSFAP